MIIGVRGMRRPGATQKNSKAAAGMVVCDHDINGSRCQHLMQRSHLRPLQMTLPSPMFERAEAVQAANSEQVLLQEDKLSVRRSCQVCLPERANHQSVLLVHDKIAPQIIQHDGIVCPVMLRKLGPDIAQRFAVKDTCSSIKDKSCDVHKTSANSGRCCRCMGTQDNFVVVCTFGNVTTLPLSPSADAWAGHACTCACFNQEVKHVGHALSKSDVTCP